MTTPQASDPVRHTPSRVPDVMIQSGLLAILLVLCWKVFSPFLTLLVWAVILAVAMYPLHQGIARRLGGRQGRASTLLVLLLVVVIVTPTALLMNSLGDSVRNFIHDVQNDTLKIPAPNEKVKAWPAVGPKIYAAWSKAAEDLPGFVKTLQPKIGELARMALAMVASLGLGLLLFIGALIIAGIIMAYGESGAGASRAIFVRISGPEAGKRMAVLTTGTVRTVAQGVIGVAFIQAMAIGLILLVARVPMAGILSVIALVLAIAQVPTLLVALPAIAYLWMGGHHGTGSAILFTVLLLVAGLLDNVLKPMLLGRGVDSPMPVVLLGALGGMASHGILGMFVGATVLALGYQIFMDWVANRPAAALPVPGSPQGDIAH